MRNIAFFEYVRSISPITEKVHRKNLQVHTKVEIHNHTIHAQRAADAPRIQEPEQPVKNSIVTFKEWADVFLGYDFIKMR